MRVVAGEAKGRRLVAPPGRATRPTSDRVREAIFSALDSIDAVRGAAVLDLFAGTGAMGIEALSRGASRATFVDSDGDAIGTIRTNLAATGFAERADVVRADVVRWLAGGGRFDLVLADPPYAFDDWTALLARVDAAIVVAESDRELDVPAGWEVLRQKRYGTTVVTIAARKGPE